MKKPIELRSHRPVTKVTAKSHRTVAKSFNVCVFGDRGIDDEYAVSDLAKEWGASSAQDNSFDFDSKRDAKGFAKEAENLPGVDRVEIINLETGEEASFDPKRKAANSSYEAFALLERLAGSSNLDDSPTLQECLKDILDASEEGTKNVPQSYYENAQEALDKYKKRDGLGAFDIEDALDDFEAMIGAKSHKPVRKSIDEDIDEDRMYTVFVDDWASMDEAERKDVIDAYEPGVSDYSAYGLDMEEVNSEPARFDVPGEDLQRFLDELDSLGVKYQAEILGGKSAKPVTKSMRDDLDAELVDLARVIGEMKVDPRYSEEITDNLEDHYDALYDAAQVGMQEFVDVLEDVGVELPGGFFQRLRKLADDVDDEEQAGKSAKPVRKSLTPAPDLLTVVQVTESLASKIEMSRDVLLATAHDAMLAGADYEEPVSLISELGQLAQAIRYLAEDYERFAVADASPEAFKPYNPWPGSLRYPIDSCARMIGVLTGDPTYEAVVETLIEVRDEMRTYCGEETGPVGVPSACCDPWK